MKISFDLRPLALTSAWAPSVNGRAAKTVIPGAQAYATAHPAVDIEVRTSPSFLLSTRASVSVLNNNYNGTTSAKGAGMATPIIEAQKVSATRVQKAQVSLVKGGDARGIPPRGRPV